MEKPQDLVAIVNSELNNKNESYVAVQYKTSDNLGMRIQLHELYSTNPIDWHHWVFNQMKFRQFDRILELGCGNGVLWKKNLIEPDWAIVLTDLSEGMLEAAKSNLSNHTNIQYEIQDIQSLSFEDKSFDRVIANHMLYHVPDRELAFQEIKRILKPGGVLYAATNGKNHMREISEWVKGFDAAIPFHSKMYQHEFDLTHGQKQLAPYFTSVDRINYESNLKISKPEHLVEYICSVEPSVAGYLNEARREAFMHYLEAYKDGEGLLHVTKETGLFICRK